MPRGRLRGIEGVGHADAFHGFLRYAVEHGWRCHAHRLQNRWRDIDHVVELSADASFVLDPRRPRDDQPVTRAAEVRSDLLRPLKRRVHRMRPADGIVVERRRRAQFVHAFEDCAEIFGDSVEEGHLVEQAIKSAFGAGTVVPLDVDDQRIVQLAEIFNRVEDAAHLVVGIGQRRGVDLHHAGKDLPLVSSQRVPCRNRFGTRGQLGVGRNDSHLPLPRECLFPHLVPALIELALELRDPFLGRVVGRMGRSRRIVLQPRLLRRDRSEHANPINALVRHVLFEEIVLRIVGWLDRLRVLVKGRLPLVGIAPDESIEVFETQARRPEVERAGLTGVPVRHIMVLTVPGRVVAVLLQDFGKRPAALWHQGVVARETSSHFHDDARRRRMMIAAGQKRRTSRRAEGRRVELSIAETALRQPIKRFRGDRTAKRAGGGKAHIIRQNDEDVGSALGAHDFARKNRTSSHLPSAKSARQRVLRVAGELETPGEPTSRRPAAPGPSTATPQPTAMGDDHHEKNFFFAVTPYSK